MKTFACVCGARLFYENSACLACGREVGWCPRCENIVGLEPEAPGYRCPTCQARLQKCVNYVAHDVCNRCVEVSPAAGPEAQSPVPALCDCCRLTATIPDLSVPGNREKWYRLEVAKRRLVYDLDLLDLPRNSAYPLTFDFKADVARPENLWRTMGKRERVLTGHADGKITINIREADDVEREKARVDLGEAQRTLIGHFRHEVGHYYWDLLVRGRNEDESRRHFGDHDTLPYAEALARYYANGTPADWRQRFVSAYASMHPWEDFAETFAAYLDMASALDTSLHMQVGGPGGQDADFDRMLVYYQRLAIFLNEMNRNLGLLDAVPEVLNAPVVEKMRFVHRLVRAAGGSPANADGR